MLGLFQSAICRRLEFACQLPVALPRVALCLELEHNSLPRLVVQELIASAAVGELAAWRLHFQREECGAADSVVYRLVMLSVIARVKKQAVESSCHQIVHHGVLDLGVGVVAVHSVIVQPLHLLEQLELDEFGGLAEPCLLSIIFAHT